MAYELTLDQVIKYPVSNEKTIRLMESENKLVFVVDMESTKSLVKQAIEQQFNVKVLSVNTYITVEGKKRAYVQFHKNTPAIDVATTLGML